MLQTPVALIIFNRPETTRRVFAEISKAKPRSLFVIADGPRPDRPADVESCAAARAVIDQVDWPCEVVKNYSDVNLGCRLRPATGMSWVFEQVDRALILEDDCVPHPTFFRFCDELLERYCNDERVMQICGTNPHSMYQGPPYSYYFSRMSQCWGWATWSRAWKHYDINVPVWPQLRDTSFLFDILPNPAFVAEWTRIFDMAYSGQWKSAWDYQWTFTLWTQNGLSIMPHVNLVSNVGFGGDATHTKSTGAFYRQYGDLRTRPVEFPLRHPPYVLRDYQYDQLSIEKELQLKNSTTLYHRIQRRASRLVRDWI